jgi:hypothetical protein
LQVLKAIVTETRNITELDKRNSNFLASFLGLAVQIPEKLATAEAFADAGTGLPMANSIIFAETLKRVIEMTNHSESEDEACLAIMKSATKLVMWMTELDTISPGYYIEYYFRQENIVEGLEYAVRNMVHLERYVVMTGGADENEGYVTLQTLVETARTSFGFTAAAELACKPNLWVPASAEVQLLPCSHVVVQLPCVVFLRSMYWITYMNKHCGFVFL